MGRLQPVIEMALEAAGPEADLARRQLEMYGLLSDEPLVITAAMGQGEDRLWTTARYANWKMIAEKTGALVTEPLTVEDLRIVPADAVLAAVSKVQWNSILTSIEQMSVFEEEDLDILGMIEAQIGVHLKTDLLDHLDTTSGFYLSETTGGGGLASGVFFVKLTGEQGLGETIDFLSGLIDDLAHAEANGYVRIRTWNHGDTAVHSLTFPGLPIPVEPSLALTDGWLFVGATPQALVAAVDHAKSWAPGLTAARGFATNTPCSLEGMTSITYSDTAASLANGYGIASLLCSALANAVRSPVDLEREPGLILPPYPVLFKNTRPSVGVTRLEGNDLVFIGSGDSSVVAGMTSLLGSSIGMVILTGIGAGVFSSLFLARSGGMSGF
jgi:hypothetical protein